MKLRMIAALLLLVVCFSIPVSAARDGALLVDDASLLTDQEARQIESALTQLNQNYGVDVVVVTVYSLDGETAEQYAEDYFDENGYSWSGILLLVSTEYNEWCITVTGTCMHAFSDAGLAYLEDQVLPDLKSGDFAGAFMEYADQCDMFLEAYENGTPYEPKEEFDILQNMVIALVVGVVAALIVTGVFRGQLKSVRAQSGAADYVKQGSLNVSRANDIYLYKNVTRREKPRNNSSGGSSHRSSSGRSHRSRSGRF